jgi:hypothetical protein
MIFVTYRVENVTLSLMENINLSSELYQQREDETSELKIASIGVLSNHLKISLQDFYSWLYGKNILCLA